MLPLEKLGEKNLTYVLYLLAEIKEVLEIQTSTRLTLPHHRYNTTIRNYPTESKMRQGTLEYLRDLGYLQLPFNYGDNNGILIEVSSQEVILTLLDQVIAIYRQKLAGSTEEKIQSNSSQNNSTVFQSTAFWERYKENYKQFMCIIELFFTRNTPLDDRLDAIYRQLKNDLLANPQVIKPYIPFESLFSAEKEWASSNTNPHTGTFIKPFAWSTIRPEIQNTYSKILKMLDDAKSENTTFSTEQINEILTKQPAVKESKDFIQKMEVTHKFADDSVGAKQPVLLSDFKKITFQHENLNFDKHIVSLVKHMNGKQIVSFIMTKEPHEKIDWSEVYESTIGDDSEISLPEKSIGWRKIRDASEEINNKVTKEIGLQKGVKFIDWDKNCFWRTV